MTIPFTGLQDALAWLDSHVDFESKTPSRRSLPTLDRMRQLADLLGNPEETFPAVHLTGTNGKGSTAAMVTAMLGAMGLCVGTYTSPNLSRVNERLAKDGEPIADAELAELLGILALLEPMMTERPTRFELLTASALRWFCDQAVDVAVVEVGLGGTWDCTNVIDADVAVLTNVSFDHTEVLGPTLEGIARDKSGIIKPGSMVVIGERDPELVDIMRQSADDVGAAGVWVIGEEFDCFANRLAVGGRLIDVRTPYGDHREMLVPLHGPHQGVNAACAIAATEAFFGAAVPEDLMQAGLGATHIAGRMEVIGRRPLCLVDGAHNVAGTEALGRALQEGFTAALADPLAGPGDRVGRGVAVVGMLGGRDPLAMLAPLQAAGIQTVVACAPDSPRALPPELVAEAARSLGMDAMVVPIVAAAVEVARGLVDEEGFLLVTGSLYVVADARSVLRDSAQRA